MPEPTTWRNMLQQLFPSGAERTRIAKRAHVSLRSLERWMHEDTKPNFPALLRLVEAIPQQRERFVQLIHQEYPEFEALLQADTTLDQLPIMFYTRVLETYTRTAEPLRFWTITHMVLEQLLFQLDPRRRGIELIVVQCVQPKPDQPVRSLYENLGMGTPPWPYTLGYKARYLGSESLSGYVVSMCQPAAIQSIDENQNRVPVVWSPHEASAAAFPLQRAGRIAGCLSVVSSQPSFFTESAQMVLRYYTNLLTLAFTTNDFYDLKEIHLRKIPSLELQEPLLAYFSRRVSAVMEERDLTRPGAERIVRQEIEEELIQQQGENDGAS